MNITKVLTTSPLFQVCLGGELRRLLRTLQIKNVSVRFGEAPSWVPSGSVGCYNNVDRMIWVKTRGESTLDVVDTILHECTHYVQHNKGDILFPELVYTEYLTQYQIDWILENYPVSSHGIELEAFCVSRSPYYANLMLDLI